MLQAFAVHFRVHLSQHRECHEDELSHFALSGSKMVFIGRYFGFGVLFKFSFEAGKYLIQPQVWRLREIRKNGSLSILSCFVVYFLRRMLCRTTATNQHWRRNIPILTANYWASTWGEWTELSVRKRYLKPPRNHARPGQQEGFNTSSRLPLHLKIFDQVWKISDLEFVLFLNFKMPTSGDEDIIQLLG